MGIPILYSFRGFYVDIYMDEMTKDLTHFMYVSHLLIYDGLFDLYICIYGHEIILTNVTLCNFVNTSSFLDDRLPRY